MKVSWLRKQDTRIRPALLTFWTGFVLIPGLSKISVRRSSSPSLHLNLRPTNLYLMQFSFRKTVYEQLLTNVTAPVRTPKIIHFQSEHRSIVKGTLSRCSAHANLTGFVSSVSPSSERIDELLTLETSAFESLYGGQFTLST